MVFRSGRLMTSTEPLTSAFTREVSSRMARISTESTNPAAPDCQEFGLRSRVVRTPGSNSRRK